MHTEERFKLLLSATPERLAAVDAALAGHPETERPATLRLLRPGEAAKATGVSRTTIWRMHREGMLRGVELRRGSIRFAEAELRALVEGRAQ